MSGFLGSDFVASDPTDQNSTTLGAGWIRDIKARLKTMLDVSMNLETGAIKEGAVDGVVTRPYGPIGTIYTSTGPGTDPIWTAGSGIPVGFVGAWAAAAAPIGWLEIDNSVKLIVDYPALAAVIGAVFGGDGVTTFQLPDAKGRGIVGLGTGDATDATLWTLGEKQGTETHELTSDEAPSHTHTVEATVSDGINGGGPMSNGLMGAGAIDNDRGEQLPGLVVGASGGSGQVHQNLQPSLGLMWIIKASSEEVGGSS